MIQTIILLLILIHFNLFKGWFLALWIIDIVLKVLGFILNVIKNIAENM